MTSIAEQWKREAKRIQPTLQQVAQINQKLPPVEERILSVNQLDAQILDKELFDILRSQFMRIFAFFKEDVVESYQPELEMLLQLVVFRISVWAQGFTYGQQLQNLKYKPMSPSQKFLFLLFTIGIPYIMKRLPTIYTLLRERFSTSTRQWPSSTSFIRAVHKVERLYQLASTINFLLFLYSGKYVSVVHRLLDIQQAYLRGQMARRVSFEYMNRQLVWNGFTEFMLFIMPLLPISRITKAFNTIIYNAGRTLGWASSSSGETSSAALNNVCPICLGPVHMPFVASCGDVFCYYCLKLAMMTEGTPSCGKCSKTITSMRRQE